MASATMQDLFKTVRLDALYRFDYDQSDERRHSGPHDLSEIKPDLQKLCRLI